MLKISSAIAINSIYSQQGLRCPLKESDRLAESVSVDYASVFTTEAGGKWRLLLDGFFQSLITTSLQYHCLVQVWFLIPVASCIMHTPTVNGKKSQSVWSIRAQS